MIEIVTIFEKDRIVWYFSTSFNLQISDVRIRKEEKNKGVNLFVLFVQFL